MIDCLIIGFNDYDFEDYVTLVKSMGVESGAFKDLDLAFIEIDNKPYRSMDLLNKFYFDDKPGEHKLFHNADFLWPVITYLGTYLTRRGYSFEYVNLFQLEKEKLRHLLTNNDVLTIAITTTLYVSPHPILEIISFIRTHNLTAKIIVGGPYVSNQIKMGEQLSAQRLFKFIDADIYVISQEGELALVNTIKALKTGSNLDCVDNIAYKKDDKYLFTRVSVESNALDENMVDYTLFDKGEIDQFLSVRTAKSCPFSCAFCGFPQRAGKYTYQSVGLVERELNNLRDLGTVTTVSFLDDTFNVPKGRFRDILHMMIRNKYKFKWNCFYRCDHGDEEIIELMKEAGCEGVFLGVESGSDALLERMKKAARRKDYLEAIPLFRNVGIVTYASLIIGFPGEDADTVHETISFIQESRPDFYRAQLWYCDPLTPVWKMKDEYGIKGAAFSWSHDTMDSRVACEWIDRIFLSVDQAIWLPQFGFEQWSVYYLQRKGMSLNRIKTFLRCFNAVKKWQLITAKSHIDPNLLESLRISCKFDRPEAPPMEPVEALSGISYLEAEEFWLDEFSSSPPKLLLQDQVDLKPGQGDQTSFSFTVEQPAIEGPASDCENNEEATILGAFALSLSCFLEKPDAVIITALEGEGGDTVIPVRLFSSPEITLAGFVQMTKYKIEQAKKHGLYAFCILNNATRMELHGRTMPVFEVGCVIRRFGSQQKPLSHESLRRYPDVTKGISLALKAAMEEAGLQADISYKTECFRRESVETLAGTFSKTLRAIRHRPYLRIGELNAWEPSIR